MFGVTIRRAAMLIAAPALVVGASASPAVASDKGYDDDYDYSITVNVCKDVHDYYNHDDDEDKGKKKGHKPKFTMHVKTYDYKYGYDYAKVKVRDGECKKVELDYKDRYFTVKEDYAHGYKFKYLECKDGYNTYYDQYKCNFKKGAKYVKVVVHNEKKDDYKNDY